MSRKKRKWNALVEQVCIERLCVVPLNSTKLLRKNGVGRELLAYVARLCRAGKRRYFSIQSPNGTRLATLTIVRSQTGWRIGECINAKGADVLEKRQITLVHTTFVEKVEYSGVEERYGDVEMAGWVHESGDLWEMNEYNHEVDLMPKRYEYCCAYEDDFLPTLFLIVSTEVANLCNSS